MKFTSWAPRPILILDETYKYNHAQYLEEAASLKIQRALLAVGLHPSYNAKESLLGIKTNAPTRRKVMRAIKAWNVAQAAFPK